MGDFFVVVLSENDKITFGNTPYRFMNRLKDNIMLDGDYSVALAEISYTHSPSPPVIPDDEKPSLFLFDFLRVVKTEGNKDYFGKWFDLGAIDFDKVSSPDHMCTLINEKIWKILPRVRRSNVSPFFYDASLDRVWFRYQRDAYYLLLVGGYLASYLGIGIEEKTNQVTCLGKSKKKATTYVYNGQVRLFDSSVPEIYKSSCQTRNFFKVSPLPVSLIPDTEFMVYTNIILPNICGNDTAQQLRWIQIKPEDRGRSVTHTFSNLFYYKLASRLLNNIQIELRTSDGEFMKLGGKTRVILKFKREDR